ncbi:type II glyceraldehyde-3-phosphate dehydrogenase [Terrihabitans sp. B22-R8]|uniref:type II glyceraldehyde-3-phosphate dehydrogenase n=1 Tax=Terrihabitans sp. B22-R8 TaxID=3425128 RepID=UPI00403CDF24
MTQSTPIRVAINGYGVIGKRVADAVLAQDDMELAGVADIVADWRVRPLGPKGIALFGATQEDAKAMTDAGVTVTGVLDDLLGQADVVVDCTPKRIAAKNVETYRARELKFIVHGGEKHDVTGHSFVAEVSFASAIGRTATRVVSCNTTSIVRTLTALKTAGLLKRARGTLLRRATDPWESHEGGIMNTLVPEPEIPSHQGPDAQSVDPDLDVVTMAVKVPQTLAHLHYWSVQLTRAATKDEVVDAFRASPRIALIRTDEGLTALNTVRRTYGRSQPPARQPLRGRLVGGYAEGPGRRAVLRLHGRQPGDRHSRHNRCHPRACVTRTGGRGFDRPHQRRVGHRTRSCLTPSGRTPMR